MLKSLFKTIWPKNNLNFKIRVIIALSLLVGAKILNVQVPFYFKQIIDTMNIDWTNEVGGISDRYRKFNFSLWWSSIWCCIMENYVMPFC